MTARRCYVVEYLGNNRAVFECSAGHRWKTRVIPHRVKGIPVALWDRQNDSGARRMASWWSREKGGTTTACPKCGNISPATPGPDPRRTRPGRKI